VAANLGALRVTRVGDAHLSEDVPPYAPTNPSPIPANTDAIAKVQAAVAEALDVQRQSTALAAVVLADLASKLSSRFDTFATWLLAGFGGAVALMLTSHDAVTLVSRYTIRTDAKLFCAAVIVTVIEKYIAIIVVAGSEGAISSRTIVLDHIKLRREANLLPSLDAKLVTAEIVRAIFPPFRSLAERPARKAEQGDHGAGMRRLVRLSQVQGLLLLVQIVLFLVALGTIIRALPG